ncbi:MAG: CvpA family protein [Acidobacteria bacterium]|nr:CvpA family protein [Acidobacteriota bacterium]
MNPLDWSLTALLVYSVVRAGIRGFILEAFALAGVVLGFLFSCWFYRSGAMSLRGLITSPELARLASFLLILSATMITATLLGKLLHHTVSAVGLGFLDRLLGTCFGLLRGTLIGVALLLAVTAFLPAAPWVENSLLAPYFLRAAHAVSFVMPSDLKSRLLDGLYGLKHTTPYWIKHPLSSHTR